MLTVFSCSCLHDAIRGVCVLCEPVLVWKPNFTEVMKRKGHNLASHVEEAPFWELRGIFTFAKI